MADFEDDVAARLHDLRVQREAKRQDAAELWVPPEYPPSLYEQLEEAPDESVDWIFDELWHGNVQINAQKKSGKTTLMLNALRSLVTGEPFLGRFAVNVQSDCRVGFLNMELTRTQFNGWLREMDLPAEAQKRIVPYHARAYGALDMSNDRAVEWLIGWLRDEGIHIPFFDPLSSFFNATRWGSGDPNDSYLRWWGVYEHVVLEAKLRGTWIGHHAGHSEEAGNRARGASAMMDKPDVNIAYRYEVGEGGYTDAPSDSKRFLSAFGRDVDVREFEIEYQVPTRYLYATGGGSRAASSVDRYALKAYDAMVAYTYEQQQQGVKEVIELKAGELSTKAGVAETSKQSASFRQGRDKAVAEGWLVRRHKPPSAYFSLGDVVPPDREKRRIEIGS
jgi:hypothetical protein